MKIDIKIGAALSLLIGGAMAHIYLEKSYGDGATLQDLIIDLASDYRPKFAQKVFNPNTMEFVDSFTMLLNNKMIDPDSIADAVLRDGDELYIFPAYRGG